MCLLASVGGSVPLSFSLLVIFSSIKPTHRLLHNSLRTPLERSYCNNVITGSISDGIAIQIVALCLLLTENMPPKNVNKFDIYLVENRSCIKSSIAIIVSNNMKCDIALCGEAAPVNCIFQCSSW